MPTVGERKKSNAKGYAKHDLKPLAKAFNELAGIIREEGLDIYSEPNKVMYNDATKDALLEFFIRDSITDQTIMEDAELIEEHNNDMENLFLNDREAILEYTATNTFNPVIGITFPMHKNIMMNNVFELGISRFVAESPKITTTMETRILIAPDGTEIDMFKEQHLMTQAIDQAAPFIAVTAPIPFVDGTSTVTTAAGYTGTDPVLTVINGTTIDNLSIYTHVSAVYVTVPLKAGDVDPNTGTELAADTDTEVKIPVKYEFSPSYGDYDRSLMSNVDVKHVAKSGTYAFHDVLMGYMEKNKIFLNGSTSVVTKIDVTARLDTSNAAVQAASVSWKERTDIFEIGSAMPINTTVSPDEVKDIAALYNENQLTKIMSLFKDALGNYKDDKIKSKLDMSFLTMPEENKLASTFDFAPDGQYALDPVEWRSKMFMDHLDTYVTVLLQVLNDPNVTISIYGRPDLIKKVTPTEYTYQSPSTVGPIELGYKKTVVTSDKRVYQFVSSDKMRGNNNFIIVLNPRNTDRFIYRIYDYQLYVSNEIRNNSNPALPAIHAFERWEFRDYQPVQGRLKILNPMGVKNIAPNDDPIGQFSYSSFNANFEG